MKTSCTTSITPLDWKMGALGSSPFASKSVQKILRQWRVSALECAELQSRATPLQLRDITGERGSPIIDVSSFSFRSASSSGLSFSPLDPSNPAFISWHLQKVREVQNQLLSISEEPFLWSILESLGRTRNEAQRGVFGSSYGHPENEERAELFGKKRDRPLHTPLTMSANYGRYAPRVIRMLGSEGAGKVSISGVLSDGTPISLTELEVRKIDWGFEDPSPDSSSPQKKIRYNLIRPYVLHADHKNIDHIVTDVERLVRDLLQNYREMSLNDRCAAIAKIHWWLAHATPFRRGSASITEVVVRSIFEVVFGSSPQLSGIDRRVPRSEDLELLQTKITDSSPQEDFQTSYCPPDLEIGREFSPGVPWFSTVFMDLEALVRPLEEFQAVYLTEIKNLKENERFSLSLN